MVLAIHIWETKWSEGSWYWSRWGVWFNHIKPKLKTAQLTQFSVFLSANTMMSFPTSQLLSIFSCYV